MCHMCVSTRRTTNPFEMKLESDAGKIRRLERELTRERSNSRAFSSRADAANHRLREQRREIERLRKSTEDLKEELKKVKIERDFIVKISLAED